MRNEMIRQAVRSVFGRAADLTHMVQIVRKDFGAYIPGVGAAVTETLIDAKFIKTETPLTRSGVETGSILEKAVHIGLMEIETDIPKADDDLILGGDRFTIVQTAPVDLGAGILYEVWYQ